MADPTKVGIIACSGEEIGVGTVSRLATRRVLELLRPQATVTLCLPLFLAGEEQERRFARQHPTITVDGCDKLCARRGTERYSGRVASSLVVTEILGELAGKCHRSARGFDRSDEEAVWLVAERIAAEVDRLATTGVSESADALAGAPCGCSCGGVPAEAILTVQGKAVAVNGLPLIFAHLYKEGLKPEDGSAGRLLETVRIYHEIPSGESPFYRDALMAAYQQYCSRQPRSGEPCE